MREASAERPFTDKAWLKAHLDDERKEAEQDRSRDEAVTSADPGPVDDADSQAAAEGLSTTPSEERAYNEHIERGAAQKGEGAPEV